MSLFTKSYIIFISIHSFLMLVDEFYFHHKRGLPKWERIGHPIDTFFVLICFSIVAFFPLEEKSMITYGICSIISSLIILKDEAVHLKYCYKPEQFIHAFVFVCHPLLLIGIFLCWPSLSKSNIPFFQIFEAKEIKYIFTAQFLSVLVFFIYQILFWNVFAKKSRLKIDMK